MCKILWKNLLPMDEIMHTVLHVDTCISHMQAVYEVLWVKFQMLNSHNRIKPVKGNLCFFGLNLMVFSFTSFKTPYPKIMQKLNTDK